MEMLLEGKNVVIYGGGRRVGGAVARASNALLCSTSPRPRKETTINDLQQQVQEAIDELVESGS
jgi:hypothetical protein